MFEPSLHQQANMAPEHASEAHLNNQFFACYEDSSFIYRHRKRPRSGESPFESSPASSTTTTDSMLTNSLQFSDSSRSSVIRSCAGPVGSCTSASRSSSRSSKCLSPPALTFNLSSATCSPGQQVVSATISKTSKRTVGCHRIERRPVEHRREASTAVNDENEPQLQSEVAKRLHLTKSTPSGNVRTTSLDYEQQQETDDKVYENLILREKRFEESRIAFKASQKPVLCGQLRHSLLSWMLRICEHQQCQDEIFPLATIILDTFLRINPAILVLHPDGPHEDTHFDNRPHLDHSPHRAPHHTRRSRRHRHYGRQHRFSTSHLQCKDAFASDSSDEDDNFLGGPKHVLESPESELGQRQLLLFAACSLLLATKLRQTPRLYIQTLVEFSKFELPIELSRCEIIDGELLMLSMLKWDLAALVTPNEFLQELLARKCRSVLWKFLAESELSHGHDGANGEGGPKLIVQEENDRQIGAKMKDQVYNLSGQKQNELVDRVNRHTQTLLELCLMDSQLSQYSSSNLAISSMAVAINGLCKTTRSANVALGEIVAQINESTNKTNELELMIDVSFQIEKYVQKLLQTTSTQADDDESSTSL